MKERLKLSEWKDLIPEWPSRIRVNHTSDTCTGGRDSMIIERKEDGTANAYCFRCGRSGYHSPTRYFKPPRKEGEAVAGSGYLPASRTSLPADASDNWHGFPREVKEWLLKGGVTSVISKEQGFLWSDSTERLWIPVRQYSKVTSGYKLAGYVERGFSPKSYLTRTDNKDEFYGYYLTDSVINNRKIVIVEDVLSALKCSQVVDSIAITGVHPKPAVISKILSGGYNHVYIFLDADNPTVRMKAREIPKRLPFVHCHIIETGRDPKYYTSTEIEELIK